MQRTFIARSISVLLPTSLFSLFAVPSFAESQGETDNIETIVVTSSLRESSVAKLSSSIAVLDQSTLFNRQAQHLDELLNAAANVNFSSGASRGRFVQIRGIGERSQFAEPINPSVAFVVDDMDFSGMAGVATLFDVEQVEVLRGPQGTSFGASAMAGVVKLKTVDPSSTENGQIKLSLAQQNSWELAAAYGNELSEKWQYRVALQQYKSDGFVENIHLNRDNTDNIDELSTRLKVRYLPSDSLTIDFSLQYFDIDNGYDAFSLDNDNKTRSDEPGFDRQETTAFGVNMQWQHDWGISKLIMAHNTSDIDYGYDEDWTFVGFHPWEYSSTDYYFRQRDNTSADLRLLSNDTARLWNNSTDWVVGFYVKRTEEDLLRQYTYSDGDFVSEYSIDTVAVYAEFNTQLSEQFSLVTGLRLEDTDIDYNDSDSFREQNEDTLVGGKVALEYQSQHGLVYGSVSRGYKLGGFNPDQRIVSERRLFDPEYNWNYEIGLKQRYFNKTLNLHLALFYMQRDNTQVSDFTTIAIDDTGATSFIDIIANADVGTNKGVELSVDYQVSDNLNLFANIGLLDASFANYTNAKGELVPEQEQAQAPDYTFNVGMDLSITDAVQLSLEADGKDDYRFSDGHDERANSHILWHGNLSYQVRDWTLSIWGKNLFDKEYYVRGFGGFNNDPREFYEGAKPYYQFGDGRQFGISAYLDF